MSCNNCPSKFKDFYSDNLYTWCTGCGNYGIHAALKRALVEQNLTPQNTLICFDIGCHGNGSDKIEGYRFHGLHGRIIPFACGASNANSKMKVIASGGDGGTLGEGINHLIHAVRCNYNVTFLLHNNGNYGLTKGQASPATRKGNVRSIAPDGVTDTPLNPSNFVLSLNPSFVARTFSGDVKHMSKIIQQGLQHKGFAFIEILQSCPTYNKETPHEWYQKHSYKLEDLDSYDNSNLDNAIQISKDLENMALGVLYKNSKMKTFMESQSNRIGIQSELIDEVKNYDINSLVKSFV